MADDVKIYIEMFGDRLFRAKLIRMAMRANDMTPALTKIGDKWIRWIELQFGTEGKRSGRPWKPLKFATVKKRGTAHPILFDEGKLFDEMTSHENIRVTDHTLFLDLDDYANKVGGFHQHGTRHMDARPVLVFTEHDNREMFDDLGDYLFGDLAAGNG